jgi:hypothetical protein
MEVVRRLLAAAVLAFLAALAALTASPLRLGAQPPIPTLTLTPSSGPPGTTFTVSGSCPSGGGSVVTQLTRDGVDVAEGSGAGSVGTDGSFSVPQRIPSARTPGATSGEGEFFQPGARYAVTARCPDGFQFASVPFDVIRPKPVALTG